MLNQTEAAAGLGISSRQLQRLMAAGLPFTPVGTRGKRFDLDECRTWLRANPTCLSSQPQQAATTCLSASTINAFTAGSRRVQVRVKPSESRPKSEQPSPGTSPSLSLVTPA